MSYIDQIPLVGPYLVYAIPFFFVLMIVVFIHEYGHFIVGRWCGVEADAFSIGFGPELFGWNDKRGTRWKLSLIPLGGYVKFRGDADAASARPDEAALSGMSTEERAGSFPAASLWRRALIVAAGPAFNFILSTIIFAGLALALGVAGNKPVVGYLAEDSRASEAGFQLEDRLVSVDGKPVAEFGDFSEIARDAVGKKLTVTVERDGKTQDIPYTYLPPVRVLTVRSDGAAMAAGIEEGDLIVAVEGKPIRLFTELREAVAASKGQPIILTVQRGDETLDLTMTPEMREIRDENGNIVTRYLIGIRHQASLGIGPPPEETGVVDAVTQGAAQTWGVVRMTMVFLYDLIGGREDVAELGGPLRIAEYSGQAAQAGFDRLITLTAILSASIGLINLFPIPVLDGGHLLFYAIEAVRGKPLNERAQEIGLTIGFALIIMLMLFATYNDVIRL